MSLATHSPQESPCSSCGAFADCDEIITELLEALEKVLPYAEAFDPFEYGRFGEPTQDDDIEQAQILITEVRSLLPEERREDE